MRIAIISINDFETNKWKIQMIIGKEINYLYYTKDTENLYSSYFGSMFRSCLSFTIPTCKYIVIIFGPNTEAIEKGLTKYVNSFDFLKRRIILGDYV